MPAAEGAVPTASSCAPRPPRGGTGCRTLFTPVKGPGWGLARMKRLASVCSRVTLLTSAGRTPASSRHTVLFSLILGGVGGRCLSREALQTCAGGGGSVAAHRERAAHGTHSTPGLPHGHAASSLRRPAFSWCAFGHLPAGGSLGLLNVPPLFFFFCHKANRLLSLKGGGAELVCGAVAESTASGALPRQAGVPSPAPLLSQRLAVPSFLFRPSSPSGPAPGGHVSPEPWVSPGLSQAPGSSGSRCQLEGPALNLASCTRWIFSFITSHPASMDGSSEDVDGHKTGPF